MEMHVRGVSPSIYINRKSIGERNGGKDGTRIIWFFFQRMGS